MILYPAMDLMNGACVRLYKGRFDQKTTYEVTPLEVAQTYKEEGAKWLHLVDLDGARNPSDRQIELIRNLIKGSGLKVQTGGGIRSEADVEVLLEAGAHRVVMGSIAVKDMALTTKILKRFGGEKICLAADVMEREGVYYVTASGWQEQSGLSLDAFIKGYLAAGLQHILCTDIDRDGTMQGCNIALYRSLKDTYPNIHIQASGGIHSLSELKELNTDGAIIGKALYEGAFSVKQALEAVSC